MSLFKHKKRAKDKVLNDLNKAAQKASELEEMTKREIEKSEDQPEQGTPTG